ncbi:MAG TPA: hypothetical protein PKY05_16245 [Fibrobacteria bacterium]|nr:hypothetical protein [Fibrobacteria bacterium]
MPKGSRSTAVAVGVITVWCDVAPRAGNVSSTANLLEGDVPLALPDAVSCPVSISP